MADSNRRLAAIMFTDIVGYTALMQNNEATALRLLEEHRSLIRPVLANHGGREVKTMGDAFLIEFDSALKATECAVEMQKVLYDHNKNATDKIHIRVGIHVGDVVHEQGDVYGDSVNIASRIEPLAPKDGVCISEQVYYQVKNKIPYGLSRLESISLKNVSLPTEVYRLELPWERSVPAYSDATSNLPKDVLGRLAVLPLTNMSSDPEDAYFADGMTEELISTLSKVKDIRVIARTSIMHYKESKKTVREIGGELGVQTVLEGSVRKVGNRARITIQLIDSATEEHLWADAYDRDLADIFGVQSEVAAHVASALKVNLPRSSLRKQTENTEAYTLYLKGLQAAGSRTGEGLREANSLFKKAIMVDPHFAIAYAGLADSYILLSYYGYMEPKDAYPRAKDAAMQALELDKELAEPHTSLSAVSQNYDWDFDAAETELKLAMELNPNYSRAHHWYALLMLGRGKFSEAAQEMELSLQLDPVSDIIGAVSGLMHLLVGEKERALRELTNVIERSPSYAIAMCWLAHYHLGEGNDAEALKWVERSLSASGTGFTLANAGNILARLGNKEEALRLLEELRTKKHSGVHFDRAVIFDGLGEIDKAFQELDIAVQLRQIPYVEHLRNRLILGSVQSDPRFEHLIKRTGLGG
jgi:adenylate cyclase